MNKPGDWNRCPHCNAEGPTVDGSCGECGYNLEGVDPKPEAQGGRKRGAFLIVAGAMAVLLLILVGVGGYLYWDYGNRIRRAHYDAGVRAMESGRWDVAVEELEAAEGLEDASQKLAVAQGELRELEALYQQGLEHLQNGRWWDAAHYFRQVVEIDREYQGSLTLLEEARKRAGRMAALQQDPDGSKSLLILNPDGEPQGSLIEGVDEVEDPKFSADGDHLVFEAWRKGKGSLHLVDVSKTKVIQLAGGAEDAWITFSSDGQWVLYGWADGGQWNLAVADSGGSDRKGLASGVDYAWGDFSRDDRWIKVWTREGGSWELSIVSLDADRDVTLVEGADKIGTVEFSPDGKHLVFGAWIGGRWNLTLEEVDGGSRTEPAVGADYAWTEFSPDGTRVLFWTWSDGRGVLSVADASGQDQMVIAENVDDAWGTFSPDGNRVLYGITSSGESRLESLNLADTQRVQLIQGMEDIWGDFSPDGKWIVYRALSDGEWILNLADARTGGQVELSSTTQYAWGSFSPDGTRIIFWEREGDQGDLRLASLGGEQVKELVGDVSQAGGGFSLDGQKLAFGYRRPDGTAALKVADVDGRNIVELMEDIYRVIWAKGQFTYGSFL